MRTTTKKLENAVTQIKVTFDKKEWAEAQDAALKRLATRVKLDGFRPGKAPVAMIKARLGKQAIYDEATDQILQKRYADIMKKAEVAPIAQPTLNIDSVDNDNLKITILCPVKPEVELGEYKGLEVKKGRVTVAKKDIEAQVENYRHQFAELTTKENGEVAKGDTVVMDFEGFIDGEAFEGGKAENHSLEIGSGQFIPGFEDQMIGMTCENEKDVVVTFPEDYQATELAGKEATFKVTVHEIKEKTLPEADDELAKDVNIDGVETLDQLKDHIKTQLKSQKETEVENKFFSDLTSALIECCKVEDSEALLNSELDTMLREVEMNLQQQGLSFELYEQFTGKNKDAIKADLTDQAKDRVKLNLILAAIVEAENIEVTDEERNSELETIANTYNRDLEEIKQIFAQNMYQIDADILNRKALDVVKENLKKEFKRRVSVFLKKEDYYE